MPKISKVYAIEWLATHLSWEVTATGVMAIHNQKADQRIIDAFAPSQACDVIEILRKHSALKICAPLGGPSYCAVNCLAPDGRVYIENPLTDAVFAQHPQARRTCEKCIQKKHTLFADQLFQAAAAVPGWRERSGKLENDLSRVIDGMMDVGYTPGEVQTFLWEADQEHGTAVKVRWKEPYSDYFKLIYTPHQLEYHWHELQSVTVVASWNGDLCLSEMLGQSLQGNQPAQAGSGGDWFDQVMQKQSSERQRQLITLRLGDYLSNGPLIAI